MQAAETCTFSRGPCTIPVASVDVRFSTEEIDRRCLMKIPCRFLSPRMWGVIGANRIDHAIADRLPQRLDIGFVPQRRHDVAPASPGEGRIEHESPDRGGMINAIG